MTKTSSVSKSQAAVLIKDLFQHFQHWIKQPVDPAFSDLEKFFTSDFQLFSNGLLVSKNLSDHLQRIVNLRKKYYRLEISGPFEEPLVSHDKLAVHYSFYLTSHAGRGSDELDIIALATLEDHKIKRWEQVVHSKGKDWLD